MARDARAGEGAGAARVRIVLQPGQHHKVWVRYVTQDGTAQAGADYRAVSGRVMFRPGTHVRDVFVPLRNDALDEANEHFHLRLYSPRGAGIVDGNAVVTILDNDPAPFVSVGDVSATEPEGGSVPMSFPVRLSAPSGRTTSVAYTVADGTAEAGKDYTVASATGELVFRAGATRASIRVNVLGDSVHEPSETLSVTLSAPKHLRIGDGSATGTIVDTDAPTLSVSDRTAVEGDAVDFTVTLSKAADMPVGFHYATSDLSAHAPGDYTETVGTGTIAVGQDSTVISVPTKEDTVYEATEAFLLKLSDVSNAAIVDGQAHGTITDDDPAPTLSIANAAAREGHAVTFTVTLTGATALDAHAEWATAPGTAGPGDFVMDHGVVTVPAGEHTATITVQTVEDRVDEVDEAFTVTLSGPHHAVLGRATAVGTIWDDDGPAVSIGDAHATEGLHVAFPVTLDKASVQDVTIQWRASNGTAPNAAVTPGDFGPPVEGSVTISAGLRTGTIAVPTVPDTLVEMDENFRVTLTHVDNAHIGDGQAVGLIVDDDLPTATIAGTADTHEGTHVAPTVTLSAPTSRTVTVTYSTRDDSATAGDHDFVAVSSGTITFGPGVTTRPAPVEVVADNKAEVDQWFYIDLGTATYATVGAAKTCIVHIYDNNT